MVKTTPIIYLYKVTALYRDSTKSIPYMVVAGSSTEAEIEVRKHHNGPDLPDIESVNTEQVAQTGEVGKPMVQLGVEMSANVEPLPQFYQT